MFYDSISICLLCLVLVPHNDLLPTSVTSASSFFLLSIFLSSIPLKYLAVNSDASKYVSNPMMLFLLDDFHYLSLIRHFGQNFFNLNFIHQANFFHS